MTPTTSSKAYAPRSTTRRSADQIARIEDALVELLDAENPMTCRQCFYRLVAMGLIDKTEQQYKGTVVRLLTRLRRRERVPFDHIADNTRWIRRPRVDRGVHSAVLRTAEAYRRAMWDDQDVYVEVWCEKDALAGVICDVTYGFDVPLLVSRGFSSVSFLHNAAQHIASHDKPAFIYYFGDHDPSGLSISRTIERELKAYAPDSEIHFQRMAVTEHQIELLNLPTRPTKESDSRSKTFSGASVDLDAIPPATLRSLVESCITSHIDPHAWDRLKEIEEQEREALVLLAQSLEQEGDSDEA